MRADELRELIRIVEESDIEEVEVSSYPWGKKVRISKRAALAAAGPLPVHAAPPLPTAPAPPPSEVTAGEGESVDAESADRIAIKTPMVGTFYAAPSPDAAPYAKVGDAVHAGQVVCIIEAMKLMNEIQSETDGTIIKVLVENGEPVEYGQVLFLMNPV